MVLGEPSQGDSVWGGLSFFHSLIMSTYLHAIDCSVVFDNDRTIALAQTGTSLCYRLGDIQIIVDFADSFHIDRPFASAVPNTDFMVFMVFAILFIIQ